MDNKYGHLFYERLKDLRKEKGLSKLGLSKKLNSVTRSSIVKWEHQYTEPTASMFITLADYFGVSIDYLVGRED